MKHDAITLLTKLFEPSDLLLFRPVETWTEGGRKRSRVDYTNVCYRPAKAENIKRTLERLESASESERTNLFFGVCPRFGSKGRYDFAWQIRTIRCLWADLDACTVDEALQRCTTTRIPRPSAIVNSGSGVHLYWRLEQPYQIDDVDDPPAVETEWEHKNERRGRKRRFIRDGNKRIYIDGRHQLTRLSPKARHLQDLLAGIATAIGGDHTTDLTRLMRLPGTLNRKDQRNGNQPVPATLVECDRGRTFPLDVFTPFIKLRSVSVTEVERSNAPASNEMEDDEIIELACNRRSNGSKIRDLWCGNWTNQGLKSASEADSCLVFTIAYYTKDADQIDRIFRRSGLMRSKWDRLRGGETYGQRTIAKALSQVINQYRDKKQASVGQACERIKKVHKGLGLPQTEIDWEFKSDQTENAIAVEFIDANQTKLRYVPSWKKWLAWDDKRWKLDVDTNRTLRLARRLVRNYWDRLLHISSEKGKEEWATFCRWANRKTSIENIVSLARCDVRTTINHESLNQNTNLLNLQNGTLDLITRQLREHRQTDAITQIANVSFDPEAECPNWRAFIDLIFGNDDEVKRYVQALLGYSCSGDVGEHILPICYGSGANGKSTLWNAVVELLGDYAMLAPSKLLLGNTNEHDTVIASLYQRRLVAVSEPEEGAKLREARVKELTGDEQITARRMREDYWSFRRTHKFWLSTNHLPQINGTDEGIWRRIKLIPFRVDLRKITQPIPDYHKLLILQEGPGILNWLLDGLHDWRIRGFVEPKSVIEQTKNYRGESDGIGRFVDDCCDVSPEKCVPSSVLFDAYRAWGGDMSQVRFSTLLQERFLCKTRTFGKYRNKRVFEGLSIAEAEEIDNLLEK